MDSNVPRIAPVGSAGFSVERAGNQGQRKKDQPPFSLNQEEEKEKKEESSENSAEKARGAENESAEEDLDVGAPKKDEAGGQLNIIA